MRKRILRSAGLALAALLLNSCGGSNPWGLTLSITDAPLDTALGVNVAIAEVDLVASDGTTFNSLVFDPPTSVNLFTFQGGLSAPLVQDLGVNPGNYVALNVTLATDPLSAQSNVTQPDGSHVLYIPQGSPNKITVPVDFSIAGNSVTNVTIDFDARKSVIQDPNDPTKYILVPSMRAVVNETSGSITGSVDQSLISATSNCLQGMAVYAYQGVVNPGDVNINLPNSPTEPYATGLVGLNSTSGKYNFTIGFLPPGTYTVAFTCQANEDIATQTDATSVVPNLQPNTIQFSAVKVTTVVPNETVFVPLP